jgi:hypothetical protein
VRRELNIHIKDKPFNRRQQPTRNTTLLEFKIRPGWMEADQGELKLVREETREGGWSLRRVVGVRNHREKDK